MEVFVTGIGLISAIGKGVDENLKNLRNSYCGLQTPSFFESKYAKLLKFGEVPFSNEQLFSEFNFDKKGITRTDLLAFTAFKEAIKDAQISEKEISSYQTALISASTVGGMCLTDQLYEDANLISEKSEYLKSYSPAAHTLRLAKEYKIKGYTNTINTACSSSANSIMLGARLIKSGRANRVIVGGVDALAKFTVNGFNSLQILSEDACTPFDENRKGLTLGEGAAYLILESEEISKNKKKYVKISGYGNANDAFHSSTLSSDAVGIVSSINKALEISGLKPEDISYINAHGTGTRNNDFAELTGYNKIFAKVPPFNSTKSYIGHTLGAAGAIEAIHSIFSISFSEIYENLNFKNKIESFDLKPVNKYLKNIEINHVLSNSYGFSGNCTSLIISKANL